MKKELGIITIAAAIVFVILQVEIASLLKEVDTLHAKVYSDAERIDVLETSDDTLKRHAIRDHDDIQAVGDVIVENIKNGHLYVEVK